ncbi:MAG: hypothetical protein BRC48_12930 [Cyanobacteria bacterium QS_9_48_30]|nr:MAG: hypothetical protein BRC48_12930 [Cyanobacteria bacterium QS_9_48_30]
MTVQNRGFTRNSKKTARLQQWLPIALVLLLAATLRFYQLGTESLWIDEIYSIRDARSLPTDLLNSTRPLYYLLLGVWMQFGSSEAWLRGLGVIFGVGSVFLIYLLGFRLSGKATGLVAALLLSLSPLAINHSQEVRMYMLSVCLGLGGTLALSHGLERPTKSSFGWWAGLRVLAILSTPLNFLLLLPDSVLLGVRFRKQRYSLLKFRKWLLLAGILVLPTLVMFALELPSFLAKKESEIPPPGIRAFVGALTRFTVWPLESPIEGLAGFYEHFFFNAYAAVLMILLGVALFNKQRSRQLFWAGTWAFLPLAVLFSLSQIHTSLWGVDRYLLFASPYVLILLAAGWVQVWSWQRILAFLVALIYAIAVGGALIHYYTEQSREDWRGVVQVITSNEQSDDAIVLFPDAFTPAVNYYYEGAIPIYVMESLSADPEVTQQDAQRALRNLPSDHQRFWLVFRFYDFGKHREQRQLLQSAIAQQFQIKKHQTFSGEVELFLVRPRSAPKRAEASSSHAQLQQPKPNSVGKIPVRVLPMLASIPERNSPNADSW